MRHTDGKRLALYTSVGETIAAMREKAGLTRARVAAELHVGSNTLDKVEQGITPCPLHVLVGLADLFDCSLDELVPVTVRGRAS